MTRAAVVIPARWGSTRFPGKVLASLGGKPLVLHVCELASRARRAGTVLVATDDERVAEVVSRAGFETAMTPTELASGTDRVAAVAGALEAEIVVGLQADEPFLEPEDVDSLIAAVEAASGSEVPCIATLSAPISTVDDWHDPNVVKVATDLAGRALYFSRSPIPYRRGASPLTSLPDGPVPAAARAHVGVYAWRMADLAEFGRLPHSELENLEGLEQLRALESGWRIMVLDAVGEPFGIDTEDDLERAASRIVATRGEEDA